MILLLLACASAPVSLGPIEVPPATHAQSLPLAAFRGLAVPLSAAELDACGRRGGPPGWSYAVLEIRTDAVLFAGQRVASPAEIRDVRAPSPALVDAVRSFRDATQAAIASGCWTPAALAPQGVLLAADARLPADVVAGGLVALNRGGLDDIYVLVADDTPDAPFHGGGASQVSLESTGSGIEVRRQVVHFEASPEAETVAVVARDGLAAALGSGPDVTLTLRPADSWGDVVATHDVVAGVGGRLVLARDPHDSGDGFAVPAPSGPTRHFAEDSVVPVLYLHTPRPGDGFWVRLAPQVEKDEGK